MPKSTHKDAIFKVFVLWRSLPPILFTDEKAKAMFQTDDPLIKVLLNIKSQREFAKYFNVAERTLSQWVKKVGRIDPLKGAKVWARKLTHNVILSMYRGAMSKDPKANADRKLFFQVVNDWVEKSKMEVSADKTLFGFLAGVNRKNNGGGSELEFNVDTDLDDLTIEDATENANTD
jgi:hypothetical protein